MLASFSFRYERLVIQYECSTGIAILTTVIVDCKSSVIVIICFFEFFLSCWQLSIGSGGLMAFLLLHVILITSSTVVVLNITVKIRVADITVEHHSLHCFLL